MRPKTPHLKAIDTREERESKLKTFILAGIEGGAAAGADTIALLARSPDSPASRAVLAMSGELAGRGLGAIIVFAGAPTALADDTWSLVFSAGFIHEIRLTTNPRILDGHEQLIIGNRSVWYGDSMRRDPLKRDAFEHALVGEAGAARAARFAFGQLWRSAQAISSCDALASVTISKTTAAPELARHPDLPLPQDLLPASPLRLGAADEPTAITETLEAWQPATRH
ncbi:MAG: hypothetical protein SFW09_18670 [Hyphomicrobiaceae bacterium]|nr:hypothetical protein [Hyphomicrobiaceae bacterium]